jgi:hypothetical protein
MQNHKHVRVIRRMQANFVVSNGYAELIDRDGNILCRRFKVEETKALMKGAAANALWVKWISATTATINRRVNARDNDEWEAKIESLMKSFALRTRDRTRKRAPGKKFFEEYATGTWFTAIDRMIKAGLNKALRFCEDEWELWTETTRSNSNRRYRGRYENDIEQSNQEAAKRNAREAEL